MVDHQQRQSRQTERADVMMSDVLNATRGGPGPSTLPLRSAPPLGMGKTMAGNSGKVRKRPAKLALVAAATVVTGGTPSKRFGAGGGHIGTNGTTGHESTSSSRSVPASPVPSSSARPSLDMGGSTARSAVMTIDGREELRDALRGAPRRRPSILFAAQPAPPSQVATAKTPRLLPTLNIQAARSVAADTTGRPRQARVSSPGYSSGLPSVWQDPSEHILSGNGSSLQHARSSYASGPIEVLPGLFLGDEFNACDETFLVQHGISTILNVAKETTLPYQENDSCRDLGFFQQSHSLSTGFNKKLSLHDEAATPTSARHPRKSALTVDVSQQQCAPQTVRCSDLDASCQTPATAVTETFFTPATSTFGQQHFVYSPRIHIATLKSSEDPRRSSLYLRNTSSTPNLQAAFDSPRSATIALPGAYRPEQCSGSSGDEDEDDELMAEGESAASSSLASHVSTHTEDSAVSSPHYDNQKLSPFDDVTVTTPSSSTFSRRSPATAAASTTCSSSGSGGSFTIALPNNAIALSVPPSPHTGRTWPIRYVKLPWTHDETDLANITSTGGFVTGCAIIADALGIDVRSGRKMASADDRPQGVGGILVHCQCGVSRSATLVIAFVMQAAAYEYDFERTRALTGMHDCYEMVKSVSSSISPNISLIYQLVEWERMLSAQVAQRQLVMAADDGEASMSNEHNMAGTSAVRSNSGDLVTGWTTRTPERRWGKEVMDEEDWMRMRAEEERKEKEEVAEEDSHRKISEVRAREAEWRAAQRQAAQDSNISETADAAAKSAAPPLTLAAGSVGARRKKPSPSLNIVNSSKTNTDRLLSAMPLNVADSESVLARPGSALLPPPSEKEEDDESELMSDDPPRPQAALADMQKSYSEAPPPTPSLTDAALKRTGSEQQTRSGSTIAWLNAERRSGSRPNSGYGIAAFGAAGQSAAERRMKHKRTFSAEVPDWNAVIGATNLSLVRQQQGGAAAAAAAASPTGKRSQTDILR